MQARRRWGRRPEQSPCTTGHSEIRSTMDMKPGQRRDESYKRELKPQLCMNTDKRDSVMAEEEKRVKLREGRTFFSGSLLKLSNKGRHEATLSKQVSGRCAH